MTAELVEAAGLQVKKSKAKNKTKQGVLMISPSHIVQAVSWLFSVQYSFNQKYYEIT